MLSYHNDKTIKFQHTPVINKTAFPINQIGACENIDIEPATSGSYDDDNSIFVSDTTGNDTTGTGTQANPYKTLLKGINSTTATKTKVMVLDSALYNEDLSSGTYTYCQGIFATTGTPQRTSRTLGFTPSDSNSIFVSQTSGGSGATGTESDPVSTIAEAITLCDTAHNSVVVLDSEIYEEDTIEFSGSFTGLYAAQGETPTLKAVFENISSDYAQSELVVDSTEYLASSGNVVDSCTLTGGRFVFAGIFPDDCGFIIFNEDGTTYKTKTVVDTATVTEVFCTALLNDTFALCWIKSSTVYYAVYDSNGGIVKAATSTGANSEPGIATFSNGNFVIVANVGTVGKCYIYDYTGALVHEKTLSAGAAMLNNDACVLSSGNVAIAYMDSSNDGAFMIIDNTGEIVKSDVYTSNQPSWASPIGISDNFVISFVDQSDSNKLKFSIVSNDGLTIGSVATISTNNISGIHNIESFDDDNWIVCFSDSTDSSKLKYVIYDSSGSAVKAITTLNTGTNYINSITKLINNNIVINQREFTSGTGAVNYYIFYPFSKPMIKSSVAGSVVNGFLIDCDDIYNVYPIDGDSGDITIKYCTIKNCSNESLSYNKIINSSIETVIDKCIISDSVDGVKITSNDVSITDCQFYRITDYYAIHTDGAGTGIIIEHNDIFDVYGGVYLENNDGDEVIKNNNIHSCDIYSINAETAITTTYSAITGTNNNVTLGSYAVRSNPLYINEGSIVPSEIDLNIKVRILGYPSDSPAYNLADDSRNSGSYDVRYIGTETSWTTISVSKPPVITPSFEYTGETNTQRRDGSYSSYKDAQAELLEMEWTGINNSDFDKIEAMWCSSESDVRIYPDPVTYPNSYSLYTLIRKPLVNSVSYYPLSRTGRQKVKLSFARAYER